MRMTRELSNHHLEPVQMKYLVLPKRTFQMLEVTTKLMLFHSLSVLTHQAIKSRLNLNNLPNTYDGKKTKSHLEAQQSPLLIRTHTKRVIM